MGAKMYKREELLERLRSEQSVVTFTTLNGDERIMTCTLTPEYIPPEHMPKSDKPAKELSEKQLENVGVYDINAKGWRSFKVKNVTDVQSMEQAHEELIETIKRPVRHYRIQLWGYGGESTYNRINKSAYEFWNKVKNEEITFDNPEFNNLTDYVLNPVEFRQHNDIPQEADFLFDIESEGHNEWYDMSSQLKHMNGVTLDSASMDIMEVDNDTSNSKQLDLLCENESIEKILNKNGKEPIIDDYDLDELADKDGHNYIFYGMSIEKGVFHDAYLKLEGKQFDVSKLQVEAMDMPNGDTMVTDIIYDGTKLDYDFGDTNGKGYAFEVWDY